jgi:hypothetical protein
LKDQHTPANFLISFKSLVKKIEISSYTICFNNEDFDRQSQLSYKYTIYYIYNEEVHSLSAKSEANVKSLLSALRLSFHVLFMDNN